MSKKSSRGIGSLWPVISLLKNYKPQLIGASLALLFTAAATLYLGRGVQVLIDQGFGDGTNDALRGAISLLIGIAAAIAVGTFMRFYLVSWLGERISADIRTNVFNNLVTLHPGFSRPTAAAKLCPA